MTEIRVTLPYHLRNLAAVGGEVRVSVAGPVTVGAVIDAVEVSFPVLRGTIREHATGRRRPFVRFFACKEDWSQAGWDVVLPDAVASGVEPLVVVGAMAGG